jgi:YcxB-like protein
MRILYELTPNDLIEAQRKHGGVWIRATPLIGLLLIIAGLASIALDPKHNVGAIVPTIVGLFLVFGLGLSIRRSFRLDNRLQQPFELVVTTEGIDISSKTSTSKYQWSAFIRYAESKNLFLVYQAPKVFNVFPKRAFAPGEEESFRGVLVERVGTTSIAHRRRLSVRTWIFLAVVLISGILLVMAIHNIVHNSR